MNKKSKFDEALIRKIDNQTAVVTIIGMGYVGLSLALLFLLRGRKGW